MEMSALLFTMVLLCSSLWELQAQDASTDPGTFSMATMTMETSVDAGVASSTGRDPVATDTDSGLQTTPTFPSHPESTSEGILASPTSLVNNPIFTSLYIQSNSSEPETTTVIAYWITVAALPKTTPETTRTPLETTRHASQTTQTTMDHTTSSTPSAHPATSRIIPTPPPTTPTKDQSISASTSPQATTARTPEETTSVTPLMALNPTSVSSTDISTTHYPEASSTTGETTDNSTVLLIPAVRDPSSVEGSSFKDGVGNQPKSQWVWVIVAMLVAALASVVCIGLLIKHRKQKGNRSFGRTSKNGRSQRSRRKKGDEDAWAGPVVMGGAENNEYGGKEENGDVENNGVPTEGPQMMLSTFAPSDEEKAVGAEGTKEAKKWEEQSPLLYIDEDVEEETAPKEQPTPSTQESAVNVEAEGEVTEESGGMLKGAVAFCQTTAV